MASLAEKLSAIAGEAFKANDLPADLGQVRVSDRPDLAQFQCNGAMAAAKLAKKNPREIAEEIVSALEKHPPSTPPASGEEGSVASRGGEIFAKIEIAGPGFINLDLTDEYIAEHLQQISADERFGLPRLTHEETAVIDFAQPNVAKPMHVGHLRSSIIGESIKRTLRFAGYQTVGDIHLGDWGTHMGMVISEYIKTGRQDFVLNNDDPQALLEDLAELYPRVSAQCKEDPARLKEAQEATVKIQNKAPDYYGLWEKIREVSVIAQKKNFEALDVHFDIWWGESTAHESIAPMVEKLEKEGFAVESDGATVFPVALDDDKKEMPPLILYKSDGAVMYGTTDLATLVDRMREYNPSKVIYVVDQRQSLHFEQVFRAAKKSGIVPEKLELTHAGFGTMNGPDGKPFKTRAGGVMKLEDLIDMGLQKARQRLNEAELAQDMSEEEKENVAHKVAIAAIKFADLQNVRTSDYVFDLDRLTSFEGKTGPYLLYQTVRIKSLLGKAQAQGMMPGEDFAIQETDRPLALLLSEFPDYFDASLRNYMPHHLCEYAYKLATTFSSFYGACHILSEEDETLRSSRLALCDLTRRQLELVLDLLGIAVPERM